MTKLTTFTRYGVFNFNLPSSGLNIRPLCVT
jgi:hypothetical protein